MHEIIKAELLRTAIGQPTAGMQVDPISICVGKLNGDLSESVVTHCVLHRAKHLDRAIKVRPCNAKVEISVVASLLAYKGIDTPSAIDPGI